MDSSERNLILRATQGEKSAFGALYEMYLEPIYRFIYFRVSNEQEAEDMAEEVFVRAWRSLPRVSDHTEIQNFRSLLYRIARNMVVDSYRKKNLEVDLEDQTFLPDRNLQPDAAIQLEEQNSLLKDALRTLEEPFREVLVHRFINGLSHADTAALMGLRENHVRVLQYRALKKLRSILDTGEPQ